MAVKILLVDDEPHLEVLIKQKFRVAIKNGDYIFDYASDGSIALEKLAADPSIDIVFTDINMPVMDGLTLLSKIKESGYTQKPIVISAYGDLGNIRTAMNRGAFDFITKPIDFSDLEKTLAKTIAETETMRRGEETKKNLDKALIEKAEAQQEALHNLMEKEKLIVNQNAMLERQVTERTAEVMMQKQLIEIKNKEIVDSIYYAKRLQEAILPSVNLLNELFAESYVLYKPKDIVAGDFYWWQQLDDDSVIVAVADCTGHGVAGSLLSMLGVSLLNQIVNEKGIVQPSEILDRLHLMVIAALKQQQTNSHEGMDIAICHFNLKEKTVRYAGANRPLLYIHNNEINIIQPDKFPVGGLQLEGRKSFTQHELASSVIDNLYMFTDGYADQFGGDQNKKLMTGRFKNMILELQIHSLTEQGELLNTYFEKWKGENEQVDDVLVMGLKW